MNPVRWLGLSVLVPGFLGADLTAGQAGGNIRVTTEEVLVDAVVRDNHEKFVRGLNSGDFEILEDGVPQQMKSFRFVGGPEAQPREERQATAEGAAPETPALPRQPGVDPLGRTNIISIVMMPSAPLGRANFRRIARSLVEETSGPDTYIGVFYFGFDAHVVQTFTQDKSALLTAIDRLGEVPGPLESQGSLDSLLDQRQQPYAIPLVSNTRLSSLTESLQAFMYEVQDMYLEAGTQKQLFGMLAFVKSLARLPGRKAVMLFSEGIRTAPGTIEIFRSVISTANRGQVTFYGLDLNDVAIAPDLGRARAALLQAAEESAKMQTDPNYVGHGAMGLVLDSFHSGPETMEELAHATGGFKVMARGLSSAVLHRIAEEVDTRYEISYVPKSEILDGRFRQIEVKVNRPKVTVQARNGYFALPRLPGQTLFPYELGALSALTVSPAPHAFPLHVSILRFRSGDAATLMSLGYQVDGSDLKPAVDTPHKQFDLRICFLSLIKDQNGEVVKKVSHEVPFSGPLAALKSFHLGTVIETQPFVLPPGRYTVESAVAAGEQNAASTVRTSLIVPARTALDVSNLVLVNSLEQVRQEDTRQFDPLVTPLGRIRPELDPRLAVTPGTKMVMYFQVYGNPAAPQPRIAVEMERDGIAAGSLAAKPLPPLSEGVLPYFTEIDVGALAPGSYVAQVSVEQGGPTVRQSLAFQVARRAS